LVTATEELNNLQKITTDYILVFWGSCILAVIQ
jgi:hypothetical protein